MPRQNRQAIRRQSNGTGLVSEMSLAQLRELDYGAWHPSRGDGGQSSAGLLTLDQLLEVPIIARGWEAARARYPDTPPARLIGELVRSQIGTMVNDLIAETQARLAGAGVETADDIRAAGCCLAGFSPAMRDAERDLKRFMYANLYHHPRQLAAARSAETIVAGLFAAYRADPAAMPGDWPARLPADEPERSRHIADFIAGMTDRYAVTRYREVVGDIDLPEGF